MAVEPQEFRTEQGRWPAPRLNSLMQHCSCPACGNEVAVRLFDTRNQPLTTVCLPHSAAEAEQLPRLPLAFVRCVDCGHIYNSLFDYSQVPYSRQPWLMFNSGATWVRHLEHVRDVLLETITPGCTVVEIGCAEGQLLRMLAAARPEARYIGFDPGSPGPGLSGNVELRRALFDPASDMGRLRPAVIICRHVLEHLQSPAGFLQQLAFAVSWEDLDIRLFAEVPSITPALNSGRTVDFFYEHHSHFTEESLERLLRRSASRVEQVETAYGSEVLCATARFVRQPQHLAFSGQASGFHLQSQRRKERICREIEEIRRQFGQVAIWGGAGKAVAFMQQYSLDRERFPLVVDSDSAKTGRHVPGTGQRIAAPTELRQHGTAAVLIATAWRARDIVLEMQATGLACEHVFLEHDGQLKHFFRDEHPWQLDPGDRSTTDSPKRPADSGHRPSLPDQWEAA